MSSEAQTALLPLDQPRTFDVTYLNHKYSLTFDRISQADWQRFFAGIQTTASNTKQGKAFSNSREFQLLELAIAKLSRVEIDGTFSALAKKDRQSFQANRTKASFINTSSRQTSTR